MINEFSEKFVVAAKTKDSIYCYVGLGNGFNGIPFLPSNTTPVTYFDKDKAEAVADSFINVFYNREDTLKIEVMSTKKYFGILRQEYSQALDRWQKDK